MTKHRMNRDTRVGSEELLRIILNSQRVTGAFIVTDSTLPKPSTVVEALSQEDTVDGKEAINSKLESLKRH